jgi:hypothetical protein
VFAVIRYRYAERLKTAEMEAWADRRRSHGTVNPLYPIPTENGSSATVIQDPFRVADSYTVSPYDLVEPVDGHDTYGEVLGIDDDEGAGYLDVGTQNYDPTVLSPQESTIYDLAQRQNSSGFSRGPSFKIPAEDGSSVVAFRTPDGGSETDGEYVVVAGEGSEYASLTPMYNLGDNATNSGPTAHCATAFTAERTTDTTYDNAVAGPIPTTSFRKPKPASSTMGCQHVVTSAQPNEASTEAEEPLPPRPVKTLMLDGEYLIVPGKQHPDSAVASYETVDPSAARSVAAHDRSL